MSLLKYIVTLLAIASIGQTLPQKDVTSWWKTGVFYQIYPRSFKDSNGDGIGDLQGIISKLDYIKELGVTAAWLSPIYKSPQVDAGYDISDFKDIQEEYGTLGDFDLLIKKANELNIKIIMDFVPNHSSDEHEWFKKSERKEDPYTDYYVWEDGKNNDDITPPNNWLSIFKYSAWKYSNIRKQWYFHAFAEAQPDLNFKSLALVDEMKDVLNFWMDRGVYGFRVDAIPYLFETGLDDEAESGNEIARPGIDYDSLFHNLTMDQEETFDMTYQFRATIDEFNKKYPNEDERIMMTEAYTNIENTMKYYGNEDGSILGAHFTFNFQLLTAVSASSKAQDVVNAINEWMTVMPKIYTANWVIGNHDRPRVATRVGKENVDGFHMLLSLLPGAQITYNGEEIGMENGEVTWEQGQDPSACNGAPEDFEKTSRDFERTPFHWSDEANAGFSTTNETWLPVSHLYETNNLVQQLKVDNSHVNIYKKLLYMRVIYKAFPWNMEISAASENVLILRRKSEYFSNCLLFNIGGNTETIDLKALFGDTISDTINVIVATPNSLNDGKTLSTLEPISLAPHESFIAEYIKWGY